MADGLADQRMLPPLGAMEFLSILKLSGVKKQSKCSVFWFELGGVSWGDSIWLKPAAGACPSSELLL